FRPLALAVAFAMFASFLLSRTFVPMMCAKFLPEQRHHELGTSEAEPTRAARVWQAIEHVLQRITHLYERLLHGALAWRGAILSGVLVLFLCSLTLALGIGSEFFPQVDAGQITLYVRAPSNLRLDASERYIEQV